MARWLILGLFVCLAAAHDAPAQTGLRAEPVRGRVVDAANGAPLRRVHITVASGDPQAAAAFTDNDGRFVIASLPATTLIVRAKKAGYVAAEVSLPPGGGTDIGFSLAKSAAVMGRVVDSNRAPVNGAFVLARLLLPDGRHASDAAVRFYAAVDPFGEYRLGGLPAGRFEITAVHVPPGSRDFGPRPEVRLFGPPDDLDFAATASVMELAAGDEARDIDFVIRDVEERCLAQSLVPSSNPDDRVASISGRVTSASGEPLVCATVRVVAPDAGVPPAFTDPQGRYALNGLPAGSFVIEARHSGHITLLYGQRTPSDVETPVTLREGEQRLRADIALPRDSIVTGTVVDEHGEPMEGVQVWAFQTRGVDAGSGGVMSTSVPRRTDDRGQYRLTGVRPGSYFVRTLVLPGALAAAEGTRAYGAVYYPGTTEAASARRVSVDGGRDAHGIDITLAPVPIAVVTGSVVHADGRPFVGRVTVTPSARSGALPVDGWTAATDATGAFSVPNVPRGEHVVKAAEADGPRGFGMAYVTVVNIDPPPVRLTLTGGATLEGRVVLEGAPDLNIAGFTISVLPATSDLALPTGGGLIMFARENDGSFRVTGARGPSRIVIGGTPACEGCYLKSAFVDGTDAVDRPFDFGLKGGVYRDVEVTVSDGAATLEGQAIDERGGRALAYSVAVFPVDRTLWFDRSRYLKVVRSDADGGFRVTALPPGEYLAAAVNRLELGLIELSNLDVLEQLAARAQPVTLAERERKNVSLRLIRR